MIRSLEYDVLTDGASIDDAAAAFLETSEDYACLLLTLSEPTDVDRSLAERINERLCAIR